MSAKQILITLTAVLAGFAAGPVLAADPPEQVMLDSMSQLFAGVEFDHAMHTELGEDCSACHHHTTGTGTSDERCLRCHADSAAFAVVGCRGCHSAEPFSATQINRASLDVYQFHTDKPGLKGALHWNCVGCHERMDGPTGCVDCHARTPEGEAFYRTGVSGEPVAGGH